MTRNVWLFAIIVVSCRSPEPNQSPCPVCPSLDAAAVHKDSPGSEDDDEEGEEHEAGPETPTVDMGACDRSWLPTELAAKPPVSETEELVEGLNRWVEEFGEEAGPLIDSQRGVVHVKSADPGRSEKGRPKHATAQSTLACGVTSLWLRSYLGATLLKKASNSVPVHCEGNACCYAGNEETSNGMIVFRRVTAGLPEPEWIMAAVIEYAVPDDRAAAAQAMQKLHKRTCPGEPPGYQ
jgi:hypothetical protein